MTIGHGPNVFALRAGRGCLNIFLPPVISPLPLSLGPSILQEHEILIPNEHRIASLLGMDSQFDQMKGKSYVSPS